MSSDRRKVLCEGFLDVKFPPNSPERALHKVWKKQWACASVISPPGRGEPHFILHLMKNQHERHHRSIKAVRDGLRLFRCRSSSRSLRTFAISSGGSLLVYLAAENEQETQNWIQLIRSGLWPPIHTFSDSPYDVSLIDDEKTFSSGLLGLYGRLVKTADNMVNIIHPHWQGTLLRWKQEDVLNIALIRKIGGDQSSAGVFKIILRSLNKEERNLHFYSSMVEEVIDWIKPKRPDSTESTVKRDLSKNPQSNINFSQNSEISLADESSYAVINKSPEITIENNLIAQKLTDTLEKLSNANTNDGHLFVNVSSDILDSSMSSIRMLSDKSKGKEISDSSIPVKGDSDSDSSNEMYEHVYEDLTHRSESFGAYTLYEEIEDPESVYVPPLPPQLPERPKQNPNSLRLLKLSESVAEALKIAETIPKPVEEQSSNVSKKTTPKKSKSLRSRPHKELPTQSTEEKCVLKRASSEPDLTDSNLGKTDTLIGSNGYYAMNSPHLPQDSKTKDLEDCNSLGRVNFKQTVTKENAVDLKLEKRIQKTKIFPKNNPVNPKAEEDYIDMK